MKHALPLLLVTLFCLACTGKKVVETAQSELPASTAESASPSAPDESEVRFAEYKKKNLNYTVKEADFPYELKGLRDVHIVEALTGEYSINQTLSNYDVYGTDLGIVFDRGTELFIAFGDTFSEPHFSRNWRSNVLAVTTDHEPADGIRFDRMITSKVDKRAIELLNSRKQDNIEMTVIPTGGFSITSQDQDSLYLCFMSVRHWGEPGRWDCNYGGIARSTNGGQSWEKLPNLQWDGSLESPALHR
jgi:hypothetical protein